eukprot:GEZU01024543.1.p1 GENE.GEZU01024543.1~~GEZU01024543.1.p1  ORF type:complete len:117 (-),score=13.36 GEZU01024543.1:61-411(-)
MRNLNVSETNNLMISLLAARSHTSLLLPPHTVSFRLYDLDHNGYITHDEMVKIVTALYRMLGNLVSMHGEEYDTPEKIVSRIFEEMDTNRDGRLSLDEYKVGALKDPAIVQGMGLF